MPKQIGSLQAVDRPASASQAAITTTAIANAAWSNSVAYNLNADLTSIKTLVNQLRTDLIAVNIIKGSA